VMGAESTGCPSTATNELGIVDEASAPDAQGLFAALMRAAWRGQDARASELTAVLLEDPAPEYASRLTALAEYARALLCNGLGRYHEALAAAARACADDDLGSCPSVLLELVEAAARTNDADVASAALARVERACTNGTDWTRGVRARAGALLAEGERAECLYLEAIELLSRSGRSEAQIARARLSYGEWLRRDNRRVDARVQLRAAHEAFNRVGAEAFADRAQRELLATGEIARKRNDESRGQLTPQEAQIAQLARDGLSNPEIAGQLFLSPRTVQYHLRKVFQKLNITSRNQLGRIPPERLGRQLELASRGSIEQLQLAPGQAEGGLK
jgi:DNA-binding CsgD family transcriptional regulator